MFKSMQTGIAVGAEGRFRRAVIAKVKLKFSAQVRAARSAKDDKEIARLEDAIEAEIRETVKGCSSPQSLW